MKTLYFAYGSNLNRGEMAIRCPGSRPIGRAQLLDYQLEFWEWAQVVRTPGSEVDGALYEITPDDELALDVYEGYTPSNPTAGEYQKITIPVMTAQGPVEAMLYVMNPRPSLRPSSEYYNKIRQGYKDWGLDETPLRHARARATQEGGLSHDSVVNLRPIDTTVWRDSVDNDPKLAHYYALQREKRYRHLERLDVRIGNEFGGFGSDAFIEIQMQSRIPAERTSLYLTFEYVSNLRIMSKPRHAIQIGCLEIDGSPGNYWVCDSDEDLVYFECSDFTIEVK